VVVVRVVKGVVMEVKRVWWVLELNRIREVLKTGSHGCQMTFHRLPLQRRPLVEHRRTKRKRLREPNLLFLNGY
jgi:hypothetical protein